MEFIKLRQLVMRQPSKECIQAPSRVRPSKVMSDLEFLNSCSSAQVSRVSLDEDGVSNPQNIVSYTLPMEVQGESGKVQTWLGRFIVCDE